MGKLIKKKKQRAQVVPGQVHIVRDDQGGAAEVRLGIRLNVRKRYRQTVPNTQTSLGDRLDGYSRRKQVVAFLRTLLEAHTGRTWIPKPPKDDKPTVPTPAGRRLVDLEE